MENKILIGTGIFVVVLLLIGVYPMHYANKVTIASNGLSATKTASAENSMAGHHSGNSQTKTQGSSDTDLGKYRTEDIPVDCRLPTYKNSVSEWAEHLGHHGETQYCLKYYN